MKLKSNIMLKSLCTILFTAFTLTSNAQQAGLHTVVIDPGHGGKDAGAVSVDKKTKEKDIVLEVSKRLQVKILKEYTDVSVFMTRDNDKFIELDKRSKFASDKGANLFISVHVNSVDGKVSGPNGYSVHLLGQSNDKNKDTFAFNMDVVRRENDVILLEDDATTKKESLGGNDPGSNILLNLMSAANRENSLLFAQLIDEKMKNGPFKKSNGVYQNNFAVLRLAPMPAVLVELGFISNPDDLSKLRNSSSLDTIVQNLFDAFKEYKKHYDQSAGESTATAAPETKPEPAPAPKVEDKAQAPAPQEDIVFGTQIFAVPNVLPEDDKRLLGYKAITYRAGNNLRYIIGISNNREEAYSEYRKIKTKYPDCMFVKIDKGIYSREN